MLSLLKLCGEDDRSNRGNPHFSCAAHSGLLVDVYWHQTHPMVTDTGAYMNTLTLPGHQLQLLGFVTGCVGAVVGISTWRERPT